MRALPGRWEVLVADGGSTDATQQLARGHPSAPRVLSVPGGRAAQLNAAASAASGDLLVFLHADSRLPLDAHALLARTPARAGNFALRFDGEDRFSRVLGTVYAVQRRCGLYYGDSTVWCTRELFTELGGYRELPIMDDYDFVRRLERATRTTCLPGPATTSSRRWRALGVPRTLFAWVVIRWLYLAGVSPARLARLYRRAR
ncbi:MAG: glycosyltransferase [Actinomycetota bacterium]|nr:glycosyltransferase [Actinomycetota bacterium]